MKDSRNTLVALIIAMATWMTVACSAEPAYASEAASQPPAPQATASQPEINDESAAVSSDSCTHPENEARCRQMEEEILAATVRLEMKQYAVAADGSLQFEDGGVSHATVIAGRYLLTHNHFALSLDDFTDGKRREVTVSTAAGQVIVQDAPFGSFDVVAAAPETLMFDFGDYGGKGLFAMVGLDSANVDAHRATQVQPGTEVAQVNWDGNQASVQWVQVRNVTAKDGTAVLELDSYLEQGASGGGVYYDGYHIANNWVRRSLETTSGQVLDQYSVAALNAAQVFTMSATADAQPDAAAEMSAQSAANAGQWQ